ncbi:O-antigen ligase domain-containing protein [Ktedonosporobacter rubrisoli]|uniref:O-antigen ligase domain-containing protein n=1 Tax=Ktedonosporobacter rubrisoli TaxID=2509675 RepID=A0A4P6K103_KTERU|nr:O-antigen ligase family protein [Ktedonosporobacter rubrisoli]QBD81744.1 O-antigen ligase domain-containing protein [Ktedonosporobacter rubrisoli]
MNRDNVENQASIGAWWSAFRLPSAEMTTTLVIYLLLTIGLAALMEVPLLPPLVGVLGALTINLIVLFFVKSELALPLYLIVAGPSVAISFASSGILSRLYLGNLLFFLVSLIWLLCKLLPNRKSGRWLLPPSLLAPLLALIVVGLVSIIYSHLSPDPNVTYSFPHATTNVLIVNAAEMMLLVGLPMFVVVVAGIIHTVRHVYWSLIGYMVVGLLYALGTIFAAPLGLYSKEVIMGIRRPEVFGSVSSGLGTLLVLFASVAFCQALYSQKTLTRTIWGLLTLIMSIGVVMTIGRESWIALFLALMTMIMVYTKNWKIPLIVALILTPLILVSGITSFFDPSQTYGTDRFKIWQDALNIWWNHVPLMGTGAGNYQFFDIAYGTDVVGVAHNQYLQVLAEMGLQGLICLLWAMAAIGWICLKSFKSARSRLSKALALAYLGYFVAIVFGGLFTSSFVPSAADGGGTASFVGASYRWLLLGLVVSIPNWEEEAMRMELPPSRSDQDDRGETLANQAPVAEYMR